MSWNKYMVEERLIPIINGLAIVMIIVSLYMDSKLVLFLAIFSLAVCIGNHFYLKQVGDLLFVENLAEKKRFFINEKGNWVITFRNEGFPILKGEIKVYFDHFVAPEGDHIESTLSVYQITVPLSIYTKQTKQFKLSFSAKMRGIAKIRKLEIHIPSLLGFGETILESKYFLNQQAIVYPERIPVKGLKDYLSNLQGTNVVPYSVYKDPLGPVGTREYVPTDSFNHIHWKASAKHQSLQTKIYEAISERGWTIAINVSDGHSITGNLERLLSCITEFAYFALEQKIPYSVCINVRTAGNTPFLFLSKGEGKEHLQKVLETLASISTQNSSLPYDHMLSFINNHLGEQPFFLHAGIRTDATKRLLFNMTKKGTRLFELVLEKETGVLTGLK
ncbi:DUF58 domain-containing protein [Neobacillus pocheonensis]|uniref:DUF58 domain-containing protein n=1 Tax=Neobacillus pocheonensis TaxID=363869 RepID=UPI003D2B8C6F